VNSRRHEHQSEHPTAPPDAYLTPEGHVAESERLLWVTDDLENAVQFTGQDEDVPRDLLTLAVLSLAHAVVALAASEFPAEGGS